MHILGADEFRSKQFFIEEGPELGPIVPPPASSSSTKGNMVCFPVCIRVKTSRVSSSVSESARQQTTPLHSLTNMSLRVKKYLSVTNFGSPSMVRIRALLKGA